MVSGWCGNRHRPDRAGRVYRTIAKRSFRAEWSLNDPNRRILDHRPADHPKIATATLQASCLRLFNSCHGAWTMIPTRFKTKLPRRLSYPIRAGSISEALAEAPHFEALSLCFSDASVSPASKFRRLLAERLPYEIMAAKYEPALKTGRGVSDVVVQFGWDKDRWEVSVYPVLVEFRPLANRLLREEGLPAMAAWLKLSDRVGWITNWQRIELIFNPTDESLISQVTGGV